VKFVSKYVLEKVFHNHKRSHVYKRCQNCDKEVRSERYKKHLEKCLNIASIHQCNLCDYKSIRKDTLKRHTKCIHQDENFHKCKTCHKNFRKSSSLNKHVKKMHFTTLPSSSAGKRKAEQPKRAREYEDNNVKQEKEEYACTKNSKAKKAETEYLCSECSYTTNRKDNLRRHKKKHINEKISNTQIENHCIHCGKEFARSYLKRHVEMCGGVCVTVF